VQPGGVGRQCREVAQVSNSGPNRSCDEAKVSVGGFPSPLNCKLLGLILVAASVLAACSIAEVVLRVLPPEVRGYDLGDRIFIHPQEFTKDRTKNSLGYHDVEHAAGSTECTRVFLMGDSYVEALSVPLSQTVGRKLEESLNEHSSRPFEVLSIGRSGWGLERELRALKELAPKYQPDIVVTLFLTLNDVLDGSPELRQRQREITSQLLRHRPGWLSLRFEDAPVLIFERSELNRFLSFRLGLLSSRRHARASGEAGIPVAYSVYRQDYDAAWTAAWVHTEEMLEETERYTREIGARYLLVSASTPQGVLGTQRGLAQLEYSYPAMKEFSWDLDKADRLISEICQRHGVPCLLLEPSFRRSVLGGDRLHWRHDGHWNARGNELAGESIAAFVLNHPM
jgi:hypothetical protein